MLFASYSSLATLYVKDQDCKTDYTAKLFTPPRRQAMRPRIPMEKTLIILSTFFTIIFTTARLPALNYMSQSGSDSNPGTLEFTAKAVNRWLAELGVKTLFIEPGRPWANGYIESFNGKLRDKLISRTIFDTLLQAQLLIARWRREYNRLRPRSSLGCRPSAPEAIELMSVKPFTTPQQGTTSMTGVT